MKIQKCSDFINEARVNKDDVKSDLLEMLKKKPNVEMDKTPNERGIYSLAGMKKYLSGYKGNAVGNALGDIQGDKDIDLKVIRVKNTTWGELVPYWYIGLTEASAKKLKDSYEAEEKEKNKKEIDKKIEQKSKAKSQRKTVKKPAKKETNKPVPAPRKPTRKK